MLFFLCNIFVCLWQNYVKFKLSLKVEYMASTQIDVKAWGLNAEIIFS